MLLCSWAVALIAWQLCDYASCFANHAWSQARPISLCRHLCRAPLDQSNVLMNHLKLELSPPPFYECNHSVMEMECATFLVCCDGSRRSLTMTMKRKEQTKNSKKAFVWEARSWWPPDGMTSGRTVWSGIQVKLGDTRKGISVGQMREGHLVGGNELIWHWVC